MNGATATRAQDDLGPAERALVLAVARDALEAAVLGRPPSRLAGEGEGRLAAPGACFVTLRARGELRGCIGHLTATGPLAGCVREMAAAAALRDTRFLPVAPSELPHLSISVSVLHPLRPIDPAAVVVGRHGLVVTRGERRGVLLPQVPVEQGWDAMTFLRQTCLKAGLPADAYLDPDARLEAFAAEVVGPAACA